MFRGILTSSKRNTSSSGPVFDIIDKENANPQVQPELVDKFVVNENPAVLATPKQQTIREKSPLLEQVTLDRAFDVLLDEMQIPPTLRPRLTGMDHTVKSAMLRSSRQITVRTPQSSRVLRKTKSTEGLDSPRRRIDPLDSPKSRKEPQRVPASSLFTSALLDTPHASGHPDRGHARGQSLTVNGSGSRLLDTGKHTSKDLKDGGKALKDSSTEKVCAVLANTSSRVLEVEFVKRLRLLLRNESTEWTEGFMKLGGYSALLTRLNELLEIEWREEQHDDRLLYEILRCLKALSTSSIGCFALRSQCPRPFVQLVSLLYSDKKPGDVGSRQVIVELLLILFDLYSSSITHTGGKPPHPHMSAFSLVRSLLLTRPPPTAEALVLPDPVSPHDFITSIHTPRIYKSYLQELSDICRDYFWVFCHPQNTIWRLEDVDEAKVERPKAPGGMTGGVEYEAMGYMTMHLRLLNALCETGAKLASPPESELSVTKLHSDLHASGLERILLTVRKASTTYYPTLHLELARYIDHARQAKHAFPWTLERAIGLPPSSLRRSSGRSTPGKNSPARPRSTVPMLPSPMKVEPLHLE